MRDVISVFYAGGAIGANPGTTTADGGYAPIYATTANILNLPCTVQYTGVEKTVDELNRITELRHYAILCQSDPGTDPDDMLVYVDNSGISHTLFVNATNDQAGRGSCWRIQATERR